MPAITLAMLWKGGTAVSMSWSNTKTSELVVGTSVAPSTGVTETSRGAVWLRASKPKPARRANPWTNRNPNTDPNRLGSRLTGRVGVPVSSR